MRRCWGGVVVLGLVVLLGVGPLACFLLLGSPPPPSYWETSGSNTSAKPAHDDHASLVDLRHFSFLRAPSCSLNSTSPPSPPFVTLVHSAPANWYNRRMIRTTWGARLPLYFLVGRTDDPRLGRALDEESRLYGDLVQGSFLDSYRNLTYKHVMGLKWAAYNCPTARYILKTDDDVFVNSSYLTEFLSEEGSSPKTGLLMCNVMPASLAKRSYRSKWRVSPVEYPHRWYPKYCAGWAVIYSRDVALTLYGLAQLNNYFWIDDVHVTGVLVTMTDYRHVHLGSLSALWTEDEPQLSLSGPTFLFALTTPSHFGELWELVNGPSSASLPSTSSSSFSSPRIPLPLASYQAAP